MIFVTGDTHGDLDFGKLELFAQENPKLTKSDYLIIAGDFGGVWSKDDLDNDLKRYEDLPFTVLFVDGNHENFDLLNAYPVTKWNGGKVHFIKSDIIHLMRGQIYEIEGSTFLTFGGATSIDKNYRVPGKEWWPQEKPTYEDLDTAIDNLRRYNNKVDFIISHSCDEKALCYPPMSIRTLQKDIYFENVLLTEIEKIAKYTHWYFGHYHLDADLTFNKTVLYQDIRQII